ncbi:MAG: 3-hydroxyacyl-CoA dehydrogenase NAD-binding domain-containing protein [Betaproteobacteria bacterium]
MKTIRLDHDAATRVATLTFDEPGSPVNTMSRDWQADLGEAVERLAALHADRALSGVILASAKTTFFAGAQLQLVMRSRAGDVGRAFAEIEQVKRNYRRLETLGVPVVACLNGSALGGGWEVALAAHARIARDDPKLRFGMPEVTLGLIPGATGITKTVRLLGLDAARPLLLEGRLLAPAEALELGLVDELVPDALALRERALTWIGAHPQARQPWDEKGHKIPGGTPSSPKIAQALVVAPAVLTKKTHHLYPAPEACLAAMVEGAQVDFDTALRIESRYLAHLMVGEVTRNMISAFFFDANAIKAGKSRPAGFARWAPQRVGVLGAGMMGAGIAYAVASRGMACVLKDVSLEKAEQGREVARRLTDRRVAAGKMSAPEQAAVLSRIRPTASMEELRGCELIIEAVFEQRALKREVTRQAEPMLAEGGVFASNTSTLPISGLAEASARPQNFVGLHFFSPVDRMPLVEIIRGQATSDETVARAFDVVLALGKTPIVVNDSRGFFTSRVFGSYVMEGAAMLGEGVPAPLIENAALQAGMPTGPLAVLDETSLALSVHVIEQTRADFAAEGRRYEASPGEALVERMVNEFGRKGRAAGGGFYDYPEGGRKRLWPGLKDLFEKPGVAVDLQELKDRLLYRQSVETARCLHEGVLTTVHDANIGSLFGIGFPAWTGGALRFVYSDPERFFARAAELARRHGPRFDLAPEVRATLLRHEPRYD